MGCASSSSVSSREKDESSTAIDPEGTLGQPPQPQSTKGKVRVKGKDPSPSPSPSPPPHTNNPSVTVIELNAEAILSNRSTATVTASTTGEQLSTNPTNILITAATPSTSHPSTTNLHSAHLLIPSSSSELSVPLGGSSISSSTSSSPSFPSHSLSLPDSSSSETASAKKRSSMRGGTKREIPPKIPIVPLVRKSTHPDRHLPLDASQFPHTSVNHATNAHGGHHGYGPGHLSHTHQDSADADASTQKLHSDTGATAPVDSPAHGMSNHHHHHHHHHSAGLASGRNRKKLRRQTSHKGLLARLALQFPLIKASFEKVHNVFERYHRERVQQLSQLNSLQLNPSNICFPLSTNKVSTNENSSVSVNGPSFMSPEAAAAVAATATAPPSSIGSNPLKPSSTNTLTVTFAGDGKTTTGNVSSSSPPLDPSHASAKQRKLTQQYLSEEISLDKLGEVLQHISGTTKTFSDEEVRSLFQLADLDGNKTISFREFLIAVSIGYFLKIDFDATDSHQESDLNRPSTDFPNSLPDPSQLIPHSPHRIQSPAVVASATAPTSASVSSSASSIPSTHSSSVTVTVPIPVSVPTPIPIASPSPSSSSPSPPSLRRSLSHLGSEFRVIQKGFKVVEKAFQDMDEDHSNSVDVSELKKALFATSQMKDQSILELRFKELDFNGDGDISLAEFLYGMTSWVSYDEEEENNAAEMNENGEGTQE